MTKAQAKAAQQEAEESKTQLPEPERQIRQFVAKVRNHTGGRIWDQGEICEAYDLPNHHFVPIEAWNDEINTNVGIPRKQHFHNGEKIKDPMRPNPSSTADTFSEMTRGSVMVGRDYEPPTIRKFVK